MNEKKLIYQNCIQTLQEFKGCSLQLTYEQLVDEMFNRFDVYKHTLQENFSCRFGTVAIKVCNNEIFTQEQLEACRALIASYKKKKYVKGFYVRVFASLRLSKKAVYALVPKEQVLYELDKVIDANAFSRMCCELANILDAPIKLEYKS